jgi:tripartite-type tricarboxylate transporter receptor subunit TctC
MHLLAAAMLALILALAPRQAAAETYPSRPVRFVLPFGAGSASDALARIIANELTKSLGQAVVVIPKPGANGAISATDVARSAPDGYSFLFGTNSPLAVVPNLMKQPPYDVLKDFSPITFLGENAFFITVHPSVPAKTLVEFIDHAKANPRKLNYASGSTFAIVSTALFAAATGIEMEHIPYKTEPDAIVDLLSGRIQLMNLTSTTTLPNAHAGKLRVLATTLPQRSPLLPDVPTLTEQGQKQLPVVAWFGLVGPAGLPPEIVARMNKEVSAVLTNPDIRRQLEGHGFAPQPSTPDGLTAYMIEQLAIWKDALKAADIPQQ